MKISVNRISKRQFDAYCYVRDPSIRITSDEIDWFEAGNRKLLGVVIFDRSDKDFGYVILGRDAHRLFRWIDGSREFCPTQKDATFKLIAKLKEYANDGLESYPQNSDVTPPHDIMENIPSEERIHRYFKILRDEPRYEAARNLIREIAYSFIDIDGNYIQQFQTDGFNARLWELFLYVFFYNSGFTLDRRFQSPDFCINKFGFKCFVEAVIVGSSPQFDQPLPINIEDIITLSLDYMPIKYGSAIYSKMKKMYWKLPHVENNPLILAIHDYHQPPRGCSPGSMTWSNIALPIYLYGMRPTMYEGKTQKNSLIYSKRTQFIGSDIERVKSHKYMHKEILSGFFLQEGSENISAILFSNGATLPTFNRMGKLAGLGSDKVKMIRSGVRYCSDRSDLIFFSEDVDDPKYEEAWSDSIIMYHNPFAKYSIPLEVMPEISHIWFDYENGHYVSHIKLNSVFSSYTIYI